MFSRLFNAEKISGYMAVLYMILVACLQLFILVVGLVRLFQ